MSEGIITLRAKVDITPEGVIFRFGSVDSDLVELISRAKDFIVDDVKELSGNYSDFTIRSKKILAFLEPPQPRD